MAIHVALNECNVPFELKKIDLMSGEGRSPEFLKINPRGQVPVLEENGHVLREGAAILIYVLEKNKSPLLPASGPERDAAIEWLMFANATLHPAYARCFFLMRNQGSEALMDVALASIHNLWKEVEQRLEQSPYVAGKSLTVADILLTVIANWSSHMPKPITLGPRCKKLFAEVIARPAYKKALEAEQVTYKAAA